MAKIEIDIPDGKIANVQKDSDKVTVIFEDGNIFSKFKTFEDVEKYIESLVTKGVKWAEDLYVEYASSWVAKHNTYLETIAKYRMVVAALTNNEHLSMTEGDLYYPIVQFCKKEKKENCYGDTVVGEVNIDGTIYEVVGGRAVRGLGAGVGSFLSLHGVSDSLARLGFRSVSSRKVAEHISKYFGKLVFEVMYGGCNADWKWIE